MPSACVCGGEGLRVCGKRIAGKQGMAKGEGVGCMGRLNGEEEEEGWEVWIEKGGDGYGEDAGEEGGGGQTPSLAVRGTVRTEHVV